MSAGHKCAADCQTDPCGGVRPFLCGAGSTAQTVSPRSSDRTPHVRARCSTMPSPRPPSADTEACAACGRVAPPPSLTEISITPSSSAQVTWSLAPGSGCACRMALLSSSLTTSAASATAASKMPAARSSEVSFRRATATLAGAQGSRTTLDFLTSRAPALGAAARCRPTAPERRCPGPGSRKPAIASQVSAVTGCPQRTRQDQRERGCLRPLRSVPRIPARSASRRAPRRIGIVRQLPVVSGIGDAGRVWQISRARPG